MKVDARLGEFTAVMTSLQGDVAQLQMKRMALLVVSIVLFFSKIFRSQLKFVQIKVREPICLHGQLTCKVMIIE